MFAHQRTGQTDPELRAKIMQSYHARLSLVRACEAESGRQVLSVAPASRC